MIYSLLGELEIGQDGELIRLPVGPTLIMLAALLINANRRMSKAELIRAAWGSDDVHEAQLYKRVKDVRDLLKTIGRDGDLSTHHQFGYEMRVPEDDVDALLFQRLGREADEGGGGDRPRGGARAPRGGRDRPPAAGAAAVARPPSAVQRARRLVPHRADGTGAAAPAGR